MTTNNINSTSISNNNNSRGLRRACVLSPCYVFPFIFYLFYILIIYRLRVHTVPYDEEHKKGGQEISFTFFYLYYVIL
jgi:hypothetical protein